MTELFATLNVAARALGVVQRGIGVAGHNIANVETPGYSRQRQVLEAERPRLHSSGLIGTGVGQITIERVHDAFVQVQLLRQASAHGATEAQSNALAALEQILNEQQSEGVTSALNEVYDAFADLSSAGTPGAPAERQSLLTAAQSAVAAIQSADSRVRGLMQGMNVGIEQSVTEINRIASAIHELNGEITRQEIVAPANDLRDRRESLLRDLAREIDIQVLEDDSGAVSVSLVAGPMLLTSGSVRQMATVQDPTNPLDPTLVNIQIGGVGGPTDITANVGGGRLGGLLRARDTTLASAVRALDTLAYNFAVSVNQVHQTGVGLDGLSGDFFAAPAVVEDAARNLQLDARVAGDPDAIAAGQTSAPLDNRVALQLAGLRDAAAPIFLPGDPPGPASGPTRSLLDHAAAIIADVGQQARTMRAAEDQQGAILDGLENRRAEVSGVSLDEEATMLIRLQAAFQANARVVSVTQQLLDDLVRLI